MLIVTCPSCQKELSTYSQAAHHHGEVAEWSDGFISNDNPKYCRYSVCAHCNTCFWLDEAKRRNGAEPTMVFSIAWVSHEVVPNPDFEGHPFCSPARNQDIVNALGGELDGKRCEYLLYQLWRRSNHSDREITEDFGNAIDVDLRAKVLTELLTIAEAMPAEDRDILREGDLMRGLGRFEDALERIEIACQFGATKANTLRDKLLQRDQMVCEVKQHVQPQSIRYANF